MKIRMITLAAGPDGVLQPGQEVKLPDKQAKALISAGYAEEVSETVRETAAVEPPEQAVTPKKTTRRRKKKS